MSLQTKPQTICYELTNEFTNQTTAGYKPNLDSAIFTICYELMKEFTNQTAAPPSSIFYKVTNEAITPNFSANPPCPPPAPLAT